MAVDEEVTAKPSIKKAALKKPPLFCESVEPVALTTRKPYISDELVESVATSHSYQVCPRLAVEFPFSDCLSSETYNRALLYNQLDSHASWMGELKLHPMINQRFEVS